MDDERSQIEEIFCAAIELRSPAERADYLDSACQGDKEVAHRVQRLVDAHFRAAGFLESPIAALATVTGSMNQEVAGATIGHYKLLERIGEGGFAVVFMAEQQQPVRRLVAIKVIKAGMDTRQVIARFEAERQALALMDHPNIAKVFDGGATDAGRPYFVMELVKGTPITRYCDQHHLSIAKRLNLFDQVCRAVEHAHQKGVIHRDLKPTNVLVTSQDDHPLAKVIDFGIAKATLSPLTDKTLFTDFRQLIGTPAYMSPEQADGSLDIDTRSDVYSLGVLLYELLTGTPPFDPRELSSKAFAEMQRILREVEPPTPSTRLSANGSSDGARGAEIAAASRGGTVATTIASSRGIEDSKLATIVRGELDWIVMRCLEKDRNRRYPTASSLAEDIQRFQENQPVLARPATRIYRLRKFARRNRVALLTVSLIAASLFVGVVASSWQAIRATQAEALAASHLQTVTKTLQAESRARNEAGSATRLAQQQAQLARGQRDLKLRNLYAAEMLLAHQDWKLGNLLRLRQTLEAHQPSKSLPDCRGWEWYYLASLLCQTKDVFNPQIGAIDDVRWNPHGGQIAILGRPGVHVYEPVLRQVIRAFPHATLAAWKPDGSQLAIVGLVDGVQRVTILSTDEWREIRSLITEEPISRLAWQLDGGALAWSYGNRLSVWDEAVDKTQEVKALDNKPVSISAMAWGSDERSLAIGSAFPSNLLIWDTTQDKVVAEFETSAERGISAVAWRSDGIQLAAGSIDGWIELWEMPSRKLITRFAAHNGHVSSCRWSPDGRSLVSGGEDNLVRIWDAATGQLLNTLPGHSAIVTGVDWSSEGQIASSSIDGDVRFWKPFENPASITTLGRHTVAWSPDGLRLVSNDPRHKGGESYSIRDWQSGQAVITLENPDSGSIFVFAWSPNSKMIAGAGFHGTVDVWDATTGKLIHSIDPAHFTEGTTRHETRCIAWSPDSRQFASCGTDRAIRIWESSTGNSVATLTGHGATLGSVCWSPDGRWLASIDWVRDIRIWSAHDWYLVYEIDQQPASTGGAANGDYVIAWSPDSRKFASANASGEIVVRELQNGEKPQLLWATNAHTSIIRSIAWSPEGNRIASGSEDRSVKIFDATTGRELLKLDGHNTMTTAVVWSPDGRRLASADSTSVQIWDAGPAHIGDDISAGSEKPDVISPTKDAEVSPLHEDVQRSRAE